MCIIIISNFKARKAGLRKSSVLEAKRNPQLFADFKFRRDALLGKY